MFEQIELIVLGLGGLGALISVLVNILKFFQIIGPDQDANWWFELFNLIAFITVGIVVLLQIEVDWSAVDSWIILIGSFLGLVWQVLGGKLTYYALRGAPIIGHSHTLAEEREKFSG